jgi:hypothetical protein
VSKDLRCSGCHCDLLEAGAVGHAGSDVRHLAGPGTGDGTSTVVGVTCCCGRQDAGDEGQACEGRCNMHDGRTVGDVVQYMWYDILAMMVALVRDVGY